MLEFVPFVGFCVKDGFFLGAEKENPRGLECCSHIF